MLTTYKCLQIFSLDLLKKKNLLNIVSIFLNVWYNSDMKLSGLGLRFSHLVFFFLFVIGVFRFSIFFCDSLLISYIAIFIHSFIHSFICCMCLCTCIFVTIVTHIKAWMWRPKFKAGCLPLITFLLFWRQHLPLSPEFSDLGRQTRQWDLVNHLCPPPPCWGYRVCTTVPDFWSGL